MSKVIWLFLWSALLIMCAGCKSPGEAVTQSASGKNIDLGGYLMMGEIEAANPETGTPQGKLIVGRATYRSRRVGIPADQKVPTTGNFKATRSKSLFGAEETIIEYDFTAGSDAEARAALEVLERHEAEAAKAFDGKTEK